MAAAGKQNISNQKLIDQAAEFMFDPLGHVYWCYPWQQAGTILRDFDGPDDWQADVLQTLGEEMLARESGSKTGAIQMAVGSGHGIGKTCLTAWIIKHFIDTRPHPQIIVTANTKQQLENKTWRELAKWHKLSVNMNLYRWTATKFMYMPAFETWYATMVPWSKERSEAFAGTHEQNVMVIFDESSGIEDIIWEVTEGAMTTPGAIWLAFGNRTRNVGRFAKAFKEDAKYWITRTVDSRSAKMADKDQIARWAERYGEDSDFFRVRVMGEEPLSGFYELIGAALVEEAQKRSLHISEYDHAPKVLGVDIARFGDDKTCIIRRQGLAAYGLEKYRSLRTTEVADRVIAAIDEWNPDAVFIDAGAMGAGVIDACIEKGYYVHEVQFGAKPLNVREYYNKRAEMWGEVKKWLERGGTIPADGKLGEGLMAPQYTIKETAVGNVIQLESKEDIKERLPDLGSPDEADALALTFASPVMSKKQRRAPQNRIKAMTEYDVAGFMA